MSIPAPDTGPARILIVDDDPGTIRLLGRILRDLGEIHFATGGMDALAQARRYPPDLLLLDLEMPDLNGLQVCLALKADPDFADLPILFVTAHNDIEIETRALEAGAVDFITKPPNPAVVQARVKTHLTLKQRTDALRRLTVVDGLTGIANRRAFDQTLAEEWRRACRSHLPLALLLADVDFFKNYNDHYGHQAGDDCLRAVARVLDAGVRRPGELVARYGGEEFALILPACDDQQARRLADLLRGQVLALGIPHAASAVGPLVSVSFGVAIQPHMCQHAASSAGCPYRDICERQGCEALVRTADRALYTAKAQGRNRVVAWPSDFSVAALAAGPSSPA